MPRRSHPLLLGALTLFLGCLVGCTTQRLPGPMKARRNPLPEGSRDLYPEGPEQVLVMRHADPVQVQPAGMVSAFPLPFYQKDIRLTAGAWVFAAPGGRAEVLWEDGTSVALYGEGAGVVGSPSRGEPTFIFFDLDKAHLALDPGDQVQLLGGGLLSADGGPVLLDRRRYDLVRVRNHSKGEVRVSFRDESFDLDPGQTLDLPILDAGGAPFASDPGFKEITAAGVAVRVTGEVERLPSDVGLRLRAAGEHEVRGRGVRVQLQPGEEVHFENLDPPSSREREQDPDSDQDP